MNYLDQKLQRAMRGGDVGGMQEVASQAARFGSRDIMRQAERGLREYAKAQEKAQRELIRAQREQERQARQQARDAERAARQQAGDYKGDAVAFFTRGSGAGRKVIPITAPSGGVMKKWGDSGVLWDSNTGLPYAMDPKTMAMTPIDPEADGKTVVKDGHVYKVVEGLPWKWVGFDPSKVGNDPALAKELAAKTADAKREADMANDKAAATRKLIADNEKAIRALEKEQLQASSEDHKRLQGEIDQLKGKNKGLRERLELEQIDAHKKAAYRQQVESANDQRLADDLASRQKLAYQGDPKGGLGLQSALDRISKSQQSATTYNNDPVAALMGAITGRSIATAKSLAPDSLKIADSITNAWNANQKARTDAKIDAWGRNKSIEQTNALLAKMDATGTYKLTGTNAKGQPTGLLHDHDASPELKAKIQDFVNKTGITEIPRSWMTPEAQEARANANQFGLYDVKLPQNFVLSKGAITTTRDEQSSIWGIPMPLTSKGKPVDVGTYQFDRNGVPFIELNKDNRLSPSQLSGSPLDGVKEYLPMSDEWAEQFKPRKPSENSLSSLNASQRREVMDNYKNELATYQQTAKDAWTGQKMDAERFNDTLTRWTVATPAQRQEMIAELDPSQANIPASERRLNTRALFEAGMISAQEGRLLERAFYGTDPVMPNVTEAFDDWMKNSNSAAAVKLRADLQAAGAMQAPKMGGIAGFFQSINEKIAGPIGNMVLDAQTASERSRAKWDLIDAAKREFLGEYKQENSLRVDYNPGAFVELRNKLMDDKPMGAWANQTAVNFLAQTVGPMAGMASGTVQLALDTIVSKLPFDLGQKLGMRLTDQERDLITLQTAQAAANMDRAIQERGGFWGVLDTAKNLTNPFTLQNVLGAYVLGPQKYVDTLLTAANEGKTGMQINRIFNDIQNDIDYERMDRQKLDAYQAKLTPLLNEFAAMGEKAYDRTGALARNVAGFLTGSDATLSMRRAPQENSLTDPNSAIAQALAGFRQTGDLAYMDMAKSAAFNSGGELALSKAVSDHASMGGRISPTTWGSPLLTAYRSGMVAPMTEGALELGTNIAAVLAGGSLKFLQVAGSAARAGSAMSKVGRAVAALDDVATAYNKAGLITRNPGTALTFGQSAWNAGLQAGKQILASSGGEFFQESVAAFGQAGATLGDAFNQGVQGAIFGVGMSAVHYPVGAAISQVQQMRRDAAETKALTKFVADYNKQNNTGTQLTIDVARQAQAYQSPQMVSTLKQQRQDLLTRQADINQALRNLPAEPQVRPGAVPYTPNPQRVELLNQKAANEAALAANLLDTAAVSEMSINTAREINALPPGQREVVDAALRAANGVPLSVSQESALLGHQTASGKPAAYTYGDDIVLTDEFREEIKQAAPETAKAPVLRKTQAERDAELRAKYGGVFRFINGRSVFIADKKPASATDPVQPAAPTAPVSSTTPAAPGFDAGNMAPPDQQPTTPVDPQIPQMPGAPADVIQPSASGPVQPATPTTPGVTPPAATPASPSPATPPTPEPTLESPDSTSATPQTPVGETPTPAPVAPSTPTNTTAPQVPAPISVTPPVTQNFQTPDGAQVTGTFEKQADGTWQQTSPEAPSFTVTPENTQFFQTLEDKAAYALNPQAPDAVQPGEFGQAGYTATTPAGSATDTTSESVTTAADPTADTTPPPLPEAETADVFTQPVNRGTALLMLQTAAPWVSSAPLVVRSPRFFTRGNRVVDAKTYAELPKQERARYTPSPSPMFAHQGKIYIDETALVEYLGGVAPEARQEKLKAALREEVIHIATMNVRKRDQIIQDWQALPDAAKQRVVESYFTNELEAAGGDWTQVEVDEFQAGAEFWRMYLNAVNDGRTTEQVDMASEVADYAATNPTFAQRLKDTLQDIARWLREELLGQLDPDTRAEFEQTAAKIDAEVAKLDAMLGITPQPATPAAEAASPMEAPVEQANAPPVSAVEPAETIDTPAAPLTRLPEKAAPRNQAFIPKPARGAQKWTQEALNTALTSAAGSFGYKIVDTGIPSPYTAYGETLNYGTSLYDKLNPGNEIGQWIDAMNAGTNPAGNAIIQAASEPGLHRVWYGHDFFTNVDNVAAEFGWSEVPSYIIQLFKDSLTRSGLPLPGVELLVQSGTVSDRVATDWLSTNIGEVFGAGLSFLGTYKLYRAAKSGRLSKPQVIFATVGIGLKVVSGVLTAQPFLILSGLADTAILVTNLDQVKAAFKKGIEEFNKKPQAVRDLYERVAPPTAVAPVSQESSTPQDGREVKLPGSYPGDAGSTPAPATTLPVQPVEGVEATPPPLPPEEVVTPEQEVVTDEATPPPLPVQPVEPAPAPTIKMAEAAKTLGVTPKELLRLVKAAVIPAERKGNNYLFTQEALDAYAAERAAKQAPVLEKLSAVAGNTATEADVADLRQRGLVDIYRGQRVINQKGYDLMDKAGMAPRLTRNQRIEEIDSQLGPVEKPASDIPLHPRVTKSGRLYLVRGPQGGTPAQIPITDDAQARTEANRVAAEFDAKEAELEARAAEMEQDADPAAEDEGMPELSDKDAKLVPKFYQLFVSQMRDFREARERGESTPESLDRLVTQAVAVAKRLGMANLHPGTLLMNMSRLPEGPLLRSQAAFIDAVHDVLQDGTHDIAPADLTLKAGIASPAGFTNRDSAPLSWAQMIQLGALKATPRPDGSLRVRMGKTPEQMKADAEQAELEAMQREYLDDLRAETGNLDKAMEDASASGFELLDAIQMAGGLPSPTSENAESHRGELTTLFESAKAMGKGAYGGKGIFVSRIFRKDAPDLDRLAQSLRGHGFDTFTPSDVLDLVDVRFTENRPMYGTTVDFDDGLSDRAVAAKPRVRLANASVTTEAGPIFLKKAHHGTPHKVDRFSLDKIGTGEGAQAFGWGLYFAEREGVANEYRERLSKESQRDLEIAVNRAFNAEGLDFAWDSERNEYFWTRYDGEPEPGFDQLPAQLQDMVEELESRRSGGNLYTVELDVDDADLLDWDAPLSTQSEKVRAANKAMEPLTGQKEFFQGVGSLPGSWLYNALAKSIANSKNALETNDRTATKNEAKLASDALLAAGISGIRYLDAGSRKNNASIFKDGDKWAVTYNNPAAGMAVQTDRFPSETEARAFLNSLPESYNFVIFDENLIRIVAENGEPVGNAEVVKNLMADSAAAGMLQEDGIPGALPLDAAAGLAESGTRPGAQPAQGAAPAVAVDARQGELGIPAEDAFAGIAYRPARIWGLQALADRFLALRNSIGGQPIQPPIFRRDFGTRQAAFREAAQAAESLYRETLANVDAAYTDRPGTADRLLPRLPEVRALFTDANGEVQLLGSRPVELEAGEPLFAKPRRQQSTNYLEDQKYHQIVPEIKSVDPKKVERRDMYEVAWVSPEVAQSMSFEEPIEVSLFADGGLKLWDGHHRLAAAKQLGMDRIPAVVQAINAKGKDINALIAEHEATADGQPLFAKRRPMRDTTAELFGDETPFNLVGETLPPSAPARPDIVVDAQAREAAFRQSGREDVGDLFAQPAPATQATPERIAATAVIDKDGTVLSSPSKTHAELMEETKFDLDGGEFPPTQNFGFVTTTGRFVEQKEAQQIAQQARQVQGNQPISGEIVTELQREGLLTPAPAIPSPAMSGRRSEGAAAPSAISPASQQSLFTEPVTEQGTLFDISPVGPRTWTQAEAARTITKQKAAEILKGSNLEGRNISTYEQAVAANNAHMGTLASEWSAVPIDEVVFENGESIPKYDAAATRDYRAASTLYPGDSNYPACQWCGKQPVRQLFQIKHDGKKLTLLAGSECITHFEEASGDRMLQDAKTKKNLADITAIRDARRELRNEFFESRTDSYGRTQSVWKNYDAEQIYNKLNTGNIDTDSGAAALTRWAKTKGPSAMQAMQEFSAFMADPKTVQQRIKRREALLRSMAYQLEPQYAEKFLPDYQVESLKRQKEKLESEIAELSGSMPLFAKPSRDVTRRNTAVQQAAQDYFDRKISQEEYLAIVRAEMPYMPMSEVPIPATAAEMDVISEDKKPKLFKASETLRAGDKVGLRLDIPAYRDHGVWIVSVHQPGTKSGAGTPIGYEPVARIRNATFESNPKAALNIARGTANKSTIARMEGEWVPSTPEEARQLAESAMNDPQWVQVGMNPFRHSWFYNRATGVPVVSAEDVVQVGGLVLAKNPVYTTPFDERFDAGGGVLFAKPRVTPQQDAEYLNLAQNPEANRAQLQRMVDEVANVDLKTIQDKWEKDGVSSFAYTSRGDITLSEIRVPKEQRGRGVGSAKMRELLAFAQKHKMRVLLTPSTDFGASSKSRLESFYRNLGFEKNAGKNKDYGTRETMIWRPVGYDKSADPVTYDATGAVIPLSERFNPESDSILFAKPRKPRPSSLLAETKSKVVAGTAVGTRNPTGKAAQEAGTDRTALVDLASMRRDPELYRKNAVLLADFPLVAGQVPEAAKIVRDISAPLKQAREQFLDASKRLEDARNELKAELARRQGVRPNKIKVAEVDKLEQGDTKVAEDDRVIKRHLAQIAKARKIQDAFRDKRDKKQAEFDANSKALLAGKKFPIELADRVYAVLKTAAVRNLELLIELFPADLRDTARLWYDGANIIAQDFAARYNTTLNRSAAVLAVFSPQKDWFMNVALGQRMMNIWANHQNTRFDDAMAKQYLMRAGEPEPQWDKKTDDYKRDANGDLVYTKGAKPIRDAEGNITGWENWDNEKAQEKFEKAQKDLAMMRGKKLSELEPEFQARFIRMWSEVYDAPGFPVVTPAGTFGNNKLSEKGNEQRLAWGSYVTIEKAIAILTAPAASEMQVISNELGVQHKVRSFYNNIVDPANADGHVTMDTHAIAAILWQALSGNSPEVSMNFGGGGASGNSNLGISGLYPAFAEAYREVAAEFGLLPREVQSITWESVRLLFPAKFKSQKANVAKVREVWDQHEQGTITTQQAHDRIYQLVDEWKRRSTLAGQPGKTAAAAVADGSGVGRPDWAEVTRSGDNNSQAPQGAADAGGLPDRGRRGDGTGRPAVGRRGAGRDAGLLPATPKGRQSGAVLGAKPRRTPPPLPPMEKRIEASLDAIENWNNVLRAAEEKPAGTSIRKLSTEIRDAVPLGLYMFYMNFMRGRLDRADALAPGVKRLIEKANQEEQMVQVGLAAVIDGLRNELKKSFGDPAFWSKNRARLKEATRMLLPVASYLQPERAGVDGGFVWREFERRSGTISQMEATDLKLKDGELFEYEGRVVRLGEYIPEWQSFVLLEPVSAEMQEAIYEQFFYTFPEALPILDRWITPDLADAFTVGEGSTLAVEFNREALLNYYNTWPKDLIESLEGVFPQVPRVEGYTPDIATQKAQANVIAHLLGKSKSPGRKFKSGALREAGKVQNLIDAFGTRAMQAHREKIRLRMREGIIEKAVVPRMSIPAENMGDYISLEDTFSDLVTAVETARYLDPKAYPNLSRALNPKDQMQLMKLVGDAARLRAGEMMIHKKVHDELMMSMAREQTEGMGYKILDWVLRAWKLSKLTVGSGQINWLSNQIQRSFQTYNSFLFGTFALMLGEKRGAKRGMYNFLYLLRGFMTDNMPNSFFNRERIGGLIPRQVFDDLTLLGSTDQDRAVGNIVEDIYRKGLLKGTADGLKQSLKQGGVPSGILYLINYSGGDVAVKQTTTYAAMQARAEVAADEAGIKKNRTEWKRKWIDKQIKEYTKEWEQALAIADLWYMNYKNVPTPLAPETTIIPANAPYGAMGPKALKLWKTHGFIFLKWTYNWFRFGKRMSLDSLLTSVDPASSKEERAQAFANMATLATIAFLGSWLLQPGDDEEPYEEIIGSRIDEDGKLRERHEDTSGRVNLSAFARNMGRSRIGNAFGWAVDKTGIGQLTSGLLKMSGLTVNEDFTNHRGDDYWMWYRNLTWLPELFMAGKLVNGDLKGFLRDTGSYFSDMASLGVLSKAGGFVQASSQDANKEPINLVTEAVWEVATAPFLPDQVLKYGGALIDPTIRRRTDNETIGFDMTPLTTIQSKIPGLTKNLPPAGKPILPVLFSENYNEYRAYQDALENLNKRKNLTGEQRDKEREKIMEKFQRRNAQKTGIDLREVMFSMGLDPAKATARPTTRDVLSDLIELQAKGVGPSGVRVYQEQLNDGSVQPYMVYVDPETVPTRERALTLFKVFAGPNIRPFPKPPKKTVEQPTLTPDFMFGGEQQANLTLPRQ